MALRCAAAGLAVAVLAPAASGATDPRALDPATRFYVPLPSEDAVRQGIELLRQRNVKGALQLAAMFAQGHAVWITGGTPGEAEKQVRRTMQAAAFQRRVPVLVAYYVPVPGLPAVLGRGRRSPARSTSRGSTAST